MSKQKVNTSFYILRSYNATDLFKIRDEIQNPYTTQVELPRHMSSRPCG